MYATYSKEKKNFIMAWNIWSAYIGKTLKFKNVMYYLNNIHICAKVNFAEDFKRAEG